MKNITKYTLLVFCFASIIGQLNAQFRTNLSSKDKPKSNQSFGSQQSPFTKYRAMNIIPDAQKDGFGNANGNDYDLAKDGAFQGVQIAVLHLYTGEGFNFHEPQKALEEKGFAVYRWQNMPPSANVLRKVLNKSSQLWIISDQTRKLNSSHLEVIRDFFNEGKGVYIWGDNSPYYADANYIAQGLFSGQMTGNTHGDKILTLNNSNQSKMMGLKSNHDITTGLQYLYEGITIATIQSNSNLKPLLYGSSNNLVAAIFEDGKRRAIIDGGFTRLFIKWDTAGTGRYVKNAAAWLVNYDLFGNSIFAD